MRNRECIKKPAPRLGGASFSEGSNFASITFPLEGDKRDKWFFYDNGRWISMEITVAGGRKLLDDGTWECNGNENFKIVAGGNVYTSDTDNWVGSTTEPDPSAGSTTDNEDFACILKNKNVRGPVATVSSDGNSVSFFVDEPNKVSHIFYKDKKWVQSKDGVNQFTGKWNCDEDHHFVIFTDDESYSSRSNNWEKISQDTFPLKFGSRGPNVVKLQKFLNSKLPNNPLTINGIFDTETENKLIQYQRQEGLI
jgi:hypothetical protein